MGCTSSSSAAGAVVQNNSSSTAPKQYRISTDPTSQSEPSNASEQSASNVGDNGHNVTAYESPTSREVDPDSSIETKESSDHVEDPPLDTDEADIYNKSEEEEAIESTGENASEDTEQSTNELVASVVQQMIDTALERASTSQE